jgi:hypothetical protein
VQRKLDKRHGNTLSNCWRVGSILSRLIVHAREYHTIRVILEKGLDKSDPEEEIGDESMPEHGNIRGPLYYN